MNNRAKLAPAKAVQREQFIEAVREMEIDATKEGFETALVKILGPRMAPTRKPSEP